jgi:hypothetical protein
VQSYPSGRIVTVGCDGLRAGGRPVAGGYILRRTACIGVGFPFPADVMPSGGVVTINVVPRGSGLTRLIGLFATAVSIGCRCLIFDVVPIAGRGFATVDVVTATTVLRRGRHWQTLPAAPNAAGRCCTKGRIDRVGFVGRTAKRCSCIQLRGLTGQIGLVGDCG